MKTADGVEFTRYTAEIEIRFTNGRECCEWCSLSFKNRKNHAECGITGEEMIAPGEAIGWRCPLRKEETDGQEISNS